MKKCCVCGTKAIGVHMSIIGQIPFYVCLKHHKETHPVLGFDEKSKNTMNIFGRRMGLMNNNNEWIDLKFYNQ